MTGATKKTSFSMAKAIHCRMQRARHRAKACTRADKSEAKWYHQRHAGDQNAEENRLRMESSVLSEERGWATLVHRSYAFVTEMAGNSAIGWAQSRSAVRLSTRRELPEVAGVRPT